MTLEEKIKEYLESKNIKVKSINIKCTDYNYEDYISIEVYGSLNKDYLSNIRKIIYESTFEHFKIYITELYVDIYSAIRSIEENNKNISTTITNNKLTKKEKENILNIIEENNRKIEELKDLIMKGNFDGK